MGRVGNIFRGLMGVLTGIVIAVIAIVTYWAYDNIADLIAGSSEHGPDILEALNQFTFPGGMILFPALGIFLIVWAVALANRVSWARIVGICLYALSIVYLITALILFLPFWNASSLMHRIHWWVVVIWFLFFLLFGSQLISLLKKDSEKQFATAYVGAPATRRCDRCGTPLDAQGRCPRCDAVAAQPEVSRQPQRPPAVARLVGEAGQFEIRLPRTLIGRDEQCDIVLEDTSVSTNHAEILFRQGQFGVRDLGSSNGTIVNGTKVEQARLESGSQLRLGRVELTFEIQNPT